LIYNIFAIRASPGQNGACNFVASSTLASGIYDKREIRMAKKTIVGQVAAR
jgi:hypothetical protein